MEFKDYRRLMPFINIGVEKNSNEKFEDRIFFCDMSEQSIGLTTVTDYPIAAYKLVSPDNKEIVIMHLSQQIP